MAPAPAPLVVAIPPGPASPLTGQQTQLQLRNNLSFMPQAAPVTPTQERWTPMAVVFVGENHPWLLEETVVAWLPLVDRKEYSEKRMQPMILN